MEVPFSLNSCRHGEAEGSQAQPISPPGRWPPTPCPAASPLPTNLCHFCPGRTNPCSKARLCREPGATPSHDERGASFRRREISTYPFGSWACLARAVASGRPTWTTLLPSSIRRRHNSAFREPRNYSSSSYCPSRRSVAPGRGSLYTVLPA